jgi:tRNA(Glu) U13 pseudouridine synthase TruD
LRLQLNALQSALFNSVLGSRIENDKFNADDDEKIMQLDGFSKVDGVRVVLCVLASHFPPSCYVLPLIQVPSHILFLFFEGYTSFSCPMFGAKSDPPTDLEMGVLKDFGLSLDDFKKLKHLGLHGGRRPGKLPLEALQLTVEADLARERSLRFRYAWQLFTPSLPSLIYIRRFTLTHHLPTTPSTWLFCASISVQRFVLPPGSYATSVLREVMKAPLATKNAFV